MSGDGKDLKTEGLALIAKGLTEALGELKELGMVGEAGAGRGFDDISLSGLELGHEALTGEFKSFCERWEWGVRSLINEGNGFAVKTGLSAGTYYENDKYVEGTFKVVTNAAIGNPYASEEDVEKMGWGDIAKSGVYGGNVDYSKESFDQAMDKSGQAWKDAGRDVMTSHTIGPVPGLNPEDLHGAFGVSDEEYNQYLDDTFGPSPEARAKAAEQQGGEG
ncbi:hypothetical protein [Streptomyces diastatochromogenes]|uniref:Uncharacterized protein n=1 Tax=Streptomyces diastatochromogenes TaxID=42236 RepID=A0A233SXY5_STRDA|nr:hypothetical protein [Streptomyces diastatochromogenes]MCZ0991784.1 hypothetical protein [Streptomyces diastatochromogenes]OXZ00508.1 hypothetical protein BEK98_00075 [Streptomyces diastatochromogenes]